MQDRRANAAQAPTGSIGPGSNLRGPDVTMDSSTVSLKVVTTAGGTWTSLLRVATTAPAPAVKHPTVAPIQQVATQTSGTVQSAFVYDPDGGQQQSQPLLIQPVTTQSESHSVVPPTLGSALFIPVFTLSVTFSSSTSTSGIPNSTFYRSISASTGRFSKGTSSIFPVSINGIGSFVAT